MGEKKRVGVPSSEKTMGKRDGQGRKKREEPQLSEPGKKKKGVADRRKKRGKIASQRFPIGRGSGGAPPQKKKKASKEKIKGKGREQGKKWVQTEVVPSKKGKEGKKQFLSIQKTEGGAGNVQKKGGRTTLFSRKRGNGATTPKRRREGAALCWRPEGRVKYRKRDTVYQVKKKTTLPNYREKGEREGTSYLKAWGKNEKMGRRGGAVSESIKESDSFG